MYSFYNGECFFGLSSPFEAVKYKSASIFNFVVGF